MLTHDYPNGSFALCVNKPTEHTLQDIIDELGIETNLNFPLYWGGPVNPGTVWMLHDSAWSIDQTVEVNDEWSMTSNIDMFRHLADGDYPQHFRLMIGYCSWARGQLQAEIAGSPPWQNGHSWLIAKNKGPEWLFDQPEDRLWETATELSSHQAVASWL